MRPVALPLFILTVASASAAQAGITSTWIGATGGLWSAPANWSDGVPGTGGVTDAVITTSRRAMSVTQNGFYSIASLTIGPGCTLVQTDNHDLTITGLVNDGVWSLNSGGSGTDINLNADMTFQGSGVLSLSSHINNRILSVAAERFLTNGANHTITGGGQLGFNNTGIINDGLIQATQASGLLIDVSNGKGFDNNNLVRARDGSTLTFFDTPVDNAGGVIRAEDASTVLFRYGSVSGGTIESVDTGELRTTPEEGTFANVTMNGLLRLPDNADLTLVGTFTNNGTISLESQGSGTDLHLNSPTVTLQGPGVLTMSSHINNRIISVNAERTLVNAAGHTIRGGGQLGFNNTTVQNKGLIEADQPSGMLLDVKDGGNNFNEGTIRVSGSGVLTIAPGAFENRGLVDVDPTRTISRSGTFSQTAGESHVDGTLGITSGSYVQTGGLLTGDGQVNGAVSMQGGSVSPSNADGSEIGSFVVNGAYTQGSDGGYVVDLGLAGNDHLQVNGAAILGGALQIRLVAPFVPVPGQEFTILNANSINGVFGCIVYPVGTGSFFSLVYGPTSVKIVVTSVPAPDADLDFDGVVGAGDISVLLGAWGTDPCNNAICCPADLNGDDIVDAADLAILLGEWG